MRKILTITIVAGALAAVSCATSGRYGSDDAKPTPTKSALARPDKLERPPQAGLPADLRPPR